MSISGIPLSPQTMSCPLSVRFFLQCHKVHLALWCKPEIDIPSYDGMYYRSKFLINHHISLFLSFFIFMQSLTVVKPQQKLISFSCIVYVCVCVCVMCDLFRNLFLVLLSFLGTYTLVSMSFSQNVRRNLFFYSRTFFLISSRSFYRILLYKITIVKYVEDKINRRLPCNRH